MTLDIALMFQQLVQDTLVDEGLRVVKESLSQQQQIKDNVMGVHQPPTTRPPPTHDGIIPPRHMPHDNGIKHQGSTPPNTTGGRIVSPTTTYGDIFPFAENKVS